MTRTVDVLDGNTFVVSDERGDIDGSPVEVHGLFDRDTRFLSRWVLTVGGQRLTTLSVDRTRYYSAQFFLAPGVASAYVNATLAVIRRRTVLDGFHEVVTLVNHDAEAIELEVVLEAAADFADLFEVKDATVDAKPGRTYRKVEADRLVLGYERESYRRETWIRADAGAVYDEQGLRFAVKLEPQQSWTCEIDVVPARHGQAATFAPRSAWDDPEQRLGLRLLRESFPVLKSSWRPLERIYQQSLQDLAALRFDLPTSPGRYMPAAGLPWFMAAFGRDSVITSFQALPFVPGLAETALVTLAQMQATGVDDFRDAEPGKILHELRFGELTAFEERPHSPYYGAADATRSGWCFSTSTSAGPGATTSSMPWRPLPGRPCAGSTSSVTATATATWSTRRATPRRAAEPVLAGLPGVHPVRRRQDRVAPARHVRAAGLRLRRQAARRPAGPRHWDDPSLADRLEQEAADLKARFNRDFWLEDARLLRPGAGRRQEARRQPHLQPRAPAVERDRGRRPGRPRGRAPPR